MHSKFFHTLAAATMTLPAVMIGNPQSPTVVAGTATFQTQGKTLKVTCSDRSIINWQSYSIATTETTQYIQPSSSAVTLSRVVGATASSISGKINGNGIVYLINPNGVVFGTKSVINTAGFLASTLDVSNSQFLAGGDLDFTGATTNTITVANGGKITASTGDVVLLGYRVVNNGLVTATQGAVRVAAGVEMTLTTLGDERITIFPSPPPPTPTGTGLNNTATGQINAFQAELKADGNPYALAIRNDGQVNANAIGTQNGRVIIYAPNGTATLNGTISAKNSTSSCGGDVIVKAHELDFTGEIFAEGREQGGFVDLSAGKLHFHGKVSTLDGKGGAGTLLLDPNDITISSGATNPPPPFLGIFFDGTGVAASNLNNSELATALGSNNVLIQTSIITPGGSGDITFIDPVAWSSTFSLTVSSVRDTNVYTLVKNDGSGPISITSGRDLNVGQAASGVPAQLGVRQGDVTLAVARDLNVIGGNSASASAQIGYDAAAVNSNITVSNLGGNLNVTGGSADDAFALIGHGGSSAVGGTKSGNIQFLAGSGLVNIQGGSGALRAFAQVGHTRGIAGAVNATGDVVVGYQASSMTVRGGSGGYGLFGHGGGTSAHSDTYSGQVKAQMGSLLIEGASGFDNFAAYGMVTFDTGAANQTMTSSLIEAISDGPITLHNVDGSLALLGAASGFGDGNITITSLHVETNNLGDLTLTADSTATENHMGLGVFGDAGPISANLNIVVDGDLLVTAGSGAGVSDISISSGAAVFNPAISANISTGGIVDMQANTGSVAISSIGTLALTANGGDLTISGNAEIAGYADTTVAASGNVVAGADIRSTNGTLSVSAGGDITVNANGRLENSGATNGNLLVSAQNIHIVDGQIANLGSGLTSLATTQDINIRAQIVNAGTGQWTLNASRDVNIGSATSAVAAQLSQTSGGPLFVQAVRDVNVLGGNTADAFAQLGADGVSVACDLSLLSVGGNLNVQGGTADRAFAAIGHGRVNGTGGSQTGNVDIGVVGGSVSLLGGTAPDTYAQVGHCHGTTSAATVSGNVQATNITGDFTATGGSGQNSYALFGHGGNTSQGDSYTGDIAVTATNVSLTGGSGTSSFAAIGITNGQDGVGPAVTVSSNQINVMSRNNLSLAAGTASRAYALIGTAIDTAAVNTIAVGSVTADAIGALTLAGSTLVSDAAAQIGLVTDSGDTGTALTFNGGAGFTATANLGGATVVNGQGSPVGSFPLQSTIGGNALITSASIRSIDTASMNLTSGSLTLTASATKEAFIASERTMTLTAFQNVTLNGAGQAAYLQNTRGDVSLVATGDLTLNSNSFIRNQGVDNGFLSVEGNNMNLNSFIHNLGSGAMTLIAQTDMNVLSSIQNPGTGAVSAFVGQDLNVGNGAQTAACRFESSGGSVAITTERHVNVTAAAGGAASITSQTGQTYSVGGNVTLTGVAGGNQATIQANNNNLEMIASGTVSVQPNTFIRNQGGTNGTLSISAGNLATTCSSGNNSFIYNLGSGTYHLDSTNDMTINSRIDNPGTGAMDIFVGGNMVIGDGTQAFPAHLGTIGADITVTVTGNLTLTAGSTGDLFAQLGGHAASVGNTLTVNAIGGDFTLNGGAGLNTYAQVGHRGLVITGSTTIGEVGGVTTLNPGLLPTAYALLGNLIGPVIP